MTVHMHRRRSRGDRAICSAELPYILVMKKMWMYLTVLVTLVTSESTFSAPRRLKNYLRSTMKQDCLNNCLPMHCHKLTTGTLYTVSAAARPNGQPRQAGVARGVRGQRLQRGLLVPMNHAKGILENLCRGIMQVAQWKRSPPCFKTLHRL